MASRIIILSVMLCFVTGIGYVTTMMPLLLPDAIAFHLIGLSGRLLDRLPGRAFNALVSGLGFISFATLIIGCSVSHITGLRALRVGCIKQGLAISACGVVLGTLLSSGPLAFHTLALPQGTQWRE
jgi:MFS family permease